MIRKWYGIRGVLNNFLKVLWCADALLCKKKHAKYFYPQLVGSFHHSLAFAWHFPNPAWSWGPSISELSVRCT